MVLRELRRVLRRLFCHLGVALAAAAMLLAPALRAAEPLTLAEALRIGENTSPRLAAQSAALGAASELVPRARELPDPKLRLGVENLPIDGTDQWRLNNDFMTMRRIGLMQEFPNGEKRKLRGERAARERDLEAAGFVAQRSLLQRDVALAWFELRFAREVRGILVELVRELRLQVDTLSAAITAGRQNTADGFALRGAAEVAQDRVIEQERVIERARYALAVWLRDDAARSLADAPDTGKFEHAPESLLANLQAHPGMQVYARREALADADIALADNSKKSDWSVELAYQQRGPAFSNMVSVMVNIDLPWEAEKRQDRDAAAKRLLAGQARAMTEDAQRMHEAEMRGYLADWQTADRRIERYQRLLVPLAHDRVAAALAAYGGGKVELGAVLEARRAQADARLGLLQTQLERARAWANLNFLMPHEAQP